MIVAEGKPAEVACRVLGVSCAGYYAWLSRGPSLRSIRHAWLTDLIGEAHAASHGAYGGRLIHAELALGRGVRVGYNTISLLMRRAGLAGRTGSRSATRIRRLATAVDLVDRRFSRGSPNELWVTDLTEHPTREGKVYCAVVLDAYSRRVVGWSIDSSPTTSLATNALGVRLAVERSLRGGELLLEPPQLAGENPDVDHGDSPDRGHNRAHGLGIGTADAREHHRRAAASLGRRRSMPWESNSPHHSMHQSATQDADGQLRGRRWR